jgi:hypothetical protein
MAPLSAQLYTISSAFSALENNKPVRIVSRVLRSSRGPKAFKVVMRPPLNRSKWPSIILHQFNLERTRRPRLNREPTIK